MANWGKILLKLHLFYISDRFVYFLFGLFVMSFIWVHLSVALRNSQCWNTKPLTLMVHQNFFSSWPSCNLSSITIRTENNSEMDKVSTILAFLRALTMQFKTHFGFLVNLWNVLNNNRTLSQGVSILQEKKNPIGGTLVCKLVNLSTFSIWKLFIIWKAQGDTVQMHSTIPQEQNSLWAVERFLLPNQDKVENCWLYDLFPCLPLWPA